MGTIIFVVLLVGVGAWLLRRSSNSSEVKMPDLEIDETGEDRWGDRVRAADDEEAVAATSDGWAFVPHRDTVQLLPVGTEEGWNAKTHLAPGDLISARVKRGSPDLDPWRLEALGRDHDYQSWSFETESAALAAFDLVKRLSVRPPTDKHGDPIPVGDEDFFVAQRKLEESAAQSTYDDPEELDDETR